MMRSVSLVLSLLFLAACAVEQPPSARGVKPAMVRFYLVHESPSDQVTQMKDPANGEPLFLAARPDLTERDVSWAELEVDAASGRPTVLVHFTVEGSDKLAALTRRNLGRRLAILVDGSILATPLIPKEISDGRFTIRGFKSLAQAQRVADSLNRR